MKPENNMQKFVELRACGKSYKEIAEELSVPVATLISWAKAETLNISNQRAIELDALSVRFSTNKPKRIELIGGIVERIQKELDTRDFTDMPTDKLFEYLLKYTAELKKEEEVPVFKEITSDIDISTWKTRVEWSG